MPLRFDVVRRVGSSGMVQSIAHSDPSERSALLRRFLGALGEAFVCAGSNSEDQGTAAALDGFARLTRAIDPMSDWPTPKVPLERLPVCRFWDSALDAGARSAASARSGILSTRAVPGGTALHAAKAELGSVWRNLSAGVRAAGPAARSGAAPAKIWLDGLRKPTLKSAA